MLEEKGGRCRRGETADEGGGGVHALGGEEGVREKREMTETGDEGETQGEGGSRIGGLW
jgi:hypothetical protein